MTKPRPRPELGLTLPQLPPPTLRAAVAFVQLLPSSFEIVMSICALLFLPPNSISPKAMKITPVVLPTTGVGCPLVLPSTQCRILSGDHEEPPSVLRL